MLSFLLPFVLFIASFLFRLASAYYPQGLITQPSNGTSIAPGASFPFTYNIRADYCRSSYNYTVWLLTSDPTRWQSSLIIGAENQFATGHYFGRYQTANYPAVPYSTNPAPDNLVMPDFSRSFGGFGIGATASEKIFYLAVIEEWADCAGSLGKRFSLTWNTVVYNATSLRT